MPNRIIRDGILTSMKVNQIDWPEEVFYRRLMSVVDDYGRFHGEYELLRSYLYPLKVDRVRVADISRWIAACETAGLIVYYKAGDGKNYIEITNFKQQVRAKESKFPARDMQMSGKCIADAQHMQSNDSRCLQMPASAHLDGVVFGDGDVKEMFSDENIQKDPKEAPLNNPPEKKEPEKPKTPEKVKYAEFVSMTPQEHGRLIEHVGKDVAEKCIEKLNLHKGSNGKRYKNDYLAILNWVVAAVQRDQGETKKLKFQDRRVDPYAV
jgi:hypothetical protein